MTEQKSLKRDTLRSRFEPGHRQTSFRAGSQPPDGIRNMKVLYIRRKMLNCWKILLLLWSLRPFRTSFLQSNFFTAFIEILPLPCRTYLSCEKSSVFIYENVVKNMNEMFTLPLTMLLFQSVSTSRCCKVSSSRVSFSGVCWSDNVRNCLEMSFTNIARIWRTRVHTSIRENNVIILP